MRTDLIYHCYILFMITCQIGTLCEKCPNTKFFFWSLFSRMQSEYGKLRTRKNSIFGHFSRSESKGPILNNCRNWIETLFEVAQGSVLVSKLFKISLADVCFILNDTDLASYTDDNNPYIVAYSTNNLTQLQLRNTALKLKVVYVRGYSALSCSQSCLLVNM